MACMATTRVLYLLIVLLCLKAALVSTATGSIYFTAYQGGSGHAVPFLEALSLLAQRGWRVTYLTLPDNERWGKQYPEITTTLVGTNLSISQEMVRNLLRDISRPNAGPFESIPQTLDNLQTGYEQVYADIKSELEKVAGDVPRPLVMCDMFAVSCMDAADSLGLTYAVTTPSVAHSAITSPPAYLNNAVIDLPATVEGLSFLQRMHAKVIAPARLLFAAVPAVNRFQARRSALGLPTVPPNPAERWRDKLVIANQWWGLEVPFPADPLLQLVGPLLPSHFPPLDDATAAWLDSLAPPPGASRPLRVMYLAFGQFTALSQYHVAVLREALRLLLEQHVIDGALWVPGRFSEDVQAAALPAAVRVMDWAPQRALLQHPAVQVFLSHCGANSVNEAIEARVALMCMPMFAEQWAYGSHLQALGAAVRLHKQSVTAHDVVAGTVSLLTDPRHAAAMDKVAASQAFAIRTRGPAYAADLIEYVAQHGIELLTPPDRRLPWWIASGLDTRMAMGITLGGIVAAMLYGTAYMLRMLDTQPAGDAREKRD